jgi:hypothetical protein
VCGCSPAAVCVSMECGLWRVLRPSRRWCMNERGAAVEWRWQEKSEGLGETLSRRHFVHRKSHTDWPGREPRPPLWEGLFRYAVVALRVVCCHRYIYIYIYIYIYVCVCVCVWVNVHDVSAFGLIPTVGIYFGREFVNGNKICIWRFHFMFACLMGAAAAAGGNLIK